MADFTEVAQEQSSLANPYGRSLASNTGTTASFRQRGDAVQKRVNDDTRVRGDANSGTAGVNGSQSGNVSMVNSMSGDDAQAQQAPAPAQNASWQATRQPVDLASVRQRVLQSLKPQQRQ